MTNSGIICSLDERYIVRFGGTSNLTANIGEPRPVLDGIFVYDLKARTVTKSAIKCPISSSFRAVLLGSNMRNELTVFGFIKQCYKSKNLHNVQTLPYHVNHLMSKWYSEEWIHLIVVECYDKQRKSGHWKVNLDKLID